jgi:transaldolase
VNPAPDNPTKRLHELGQSLWIDNIDRDMLATGKLREYIDELSVTGLTSNPTIFEKAIGGGVAYDDSIRRLAAEGRSGEDLFFELALEDLREAADLFVAVHERTDGVDGWVSLEVSPRIADDTEATIEQVQRLHIESRRNNIYIKIPGTMAGGKAIEESIHAAIPVNVTLLFSTEHYLASAEAYMRGIERRIEDGEDPDVPSVASLFISRWDKAVSEEVPDDLRDKLGIAVAKRTYRAYRELHESDRWQRLENEGARPQRLLWASTGTKDPEARDVLYVEALAAPLTINTMPDKTLLAFADHGEVREPLPPDGGDAEEVLAAFNQAGIDTDALAERLQKEGAEIFTKSWADLMGTIESETEKLAA